MKKLFYCLLGVVLLAFILFFSFPKIASTPFGKKIFQSILSQKLGGHLKIGSLNLSWKGPQKIHSVNFESKTSRFSFAEFKAEVPFWSLFFINERFFSSLKGPLELKEGSITFFSNGSSAKLEKIFIKAYPKSNNSVDVSIQGMSNIRGSFSIHTILKDQNPFPQSLQAQLIDFPSIGIDQLVQTTKLKKKIKKEPLFFSNLLGQTINLSLFIENNVIDFDLKSTFSQLNFAASYSPNRLILTKPLLSTFRLSSFLGKDDMRSLKPSNLYIEQNASIPTSFSIEDSSIAFATLDIGQIELRNNESLGTVIELIKSRSLQRAETMVVWAAPVNFKIQNGLLTTDRMDILLERSIHIATWGDINLKTKKLDMVLGLPADTLERIFHIRPLPEDYVMQIPMRGTTSKPKIDGKAAAAKIASLAIAVQASQALPLLGEFLQMINEQKAPPPKKPFPWEK